MKGEVFEKISALLTAAFGLVAALAWNSAIQGIFNTYYASGKGIAAMIWYAVIVTVIAVLVTIWIGKIAQRIQNRKEAREKEERKKGKK